MGVVIGIAGMTGAVLVLGTVGLGIFFTTCTSSSSDSSSSSESSSSSSSSSSLGINLRPGLPVGLLAFKNKLIISTCFYKTENIKKKF
ncbi:hypothetical protein BDF21DRAFT_136149 [Thamnidium elegans]|nr:hypothetical protein BDF21DRAFT_136149 [Thamnidium elegans]